MTVELIYLALSIVLAFAQLLLAAFAATHVRGLAWNAGARDAVLPPLEGVAGRLERAQRNMMETFPLFVGAVAIAHFAGAHNWLSIGGAGLYFWGRLVYVPLYVLGVPYVRSMVWSFAMAGLFLVLLSPLA